MNPFSAFGRTAARPFLGATALLCVGCSIFEDTDLLQLESVLPAGFETTFVVFEGARRHEFRHEDMALRVAPNVRMARLSVREGSPLRVEFVVTTSATDTVATGQVELPIKDENEYSVHLSRLPAGLPTGCFGCTGTRTYPLGGSESGSGDVIVMYYTASKPCPHCVY